MKTTSVKKKKREPLSCASSSEQDKDSSIVIITQNSQNRVKNRVQFITQNTENIFFKIDLAYFSSCFEHVQIQTMSEKIVESILEKQARKLRYRVVIRDREGGAWISQIYQNAFTGADAYVFLSNSSSHIAFQYSYTTYFRLEKMIQMLEAGKEDASESKAISILSSMMSNGYFSRVNGSRTFRSKKGALYRFKWDDPMYQSNRAKSSDLEWEFPKHVKANAFILGTALGDWLENALGKGSARDIQRAIVAVRQKVLDVGRFNGNFMKSDVRIH